MYGARRGIDMSIGIDSPTVRMHVPAAEIDAVGSPAVATAIMMDVWKRSGEMKTCHVDAAGRRARRPVWSELLVVVLQILNPQYFVLQGSFEVPVFQLIFCCYIL